MDSQWSLGWQSAGNATCDWSTRRLSPKVSEGRIPSYGFCYWVDKSGPCDDPLWRGPYAKPATGWFGGPRPVSSDGKLIVDGEEVRVDPGFRVGVQQSLKLRSFGDLVMGGRNSAATLHAPSTTHRGIA